MVKQKSARHAVSDQRIRLLDLSRELGVSPTTISRALRDKVGMSEQTRNRIKQAAQKHGYISNTAGASLSTGRVFSIGYAILRDERGLQQGQLQVDVMRGMLEELAPLGYSLTVYSEDYFRAQGGSIFDVAQRIRVDGLALTIEHSDPVKPPKKQLPFPLVVVNRHLEGIDANFVLADEERGGQLAVAHLIEGGHSRIAYVGGPRDHAALTRRQAGYVSALGAAGIEPDSALIEHAHDLSWRGGYAACKTLLAKPAARFTAVFCGSDILAFGVLKCLQDEGWSVPEDVAVTSFDDSMLADMVDPALTTVRKHRQAMGKEAARILMGRLNGNTVPSEVVLPVELIVRNSSRPTSTAKR